jgi:hypothetical protein
VRAVAFVSAVVSAVVTGTYRYRSAGCSVILGAEEFRSWQSQRVRESCSADPQQKQIHTQYCYTTVYTTARSFSSCEELPLQTLIGPNFFSVGPFLFIFHIRVRRCMLFQRAKGLVLNCPP